LIAQMLPDGVSMVKFLNLTEYSVYDDHKNYRAVSKVLNSKERARLVQITNGVLF